MEMETWNYDNTSINMKNKAWENENKHTMDKDKNPNQRNSWLITIGRDLKKKAQTEYVVHNSDRKWNWTDRDYKTSHTFKAKVIIQHIDWIVSFAIHEMIGIIITCNCMCVLSIADNNIEKRCFVVESNLRSSRITKPVDLIRT